MKRPQDDESAQEDQPPAQRARLEILCSLVHGNLDHGDDMRQEAKEIKQLIQAANGCVSLNILEEQPSGTTIGRLGGSLTADQELLAKKVEMVNIEERGARALQVWQLPEA